MIKEDEEIEGSELIITPCTKRNSNEGLDNYLKTQQEYNGSYFDLDYN